MCVNQQLLSNLYPMSSDNNAIPLQVNQKAKEDRAERYKKKKTQSKGARIYACDVCDAHGKIRSRFHRCQACKELQYCTTCARTESQLIHNHFDDLKERKGKDKNYNKCVEGSLMRVYHQFPLLDDPDKGSLSRFFVCGTCYEEALQEEGLVQGDNDLYLLEDSSDEEKDPSDSDYEADDEDSSTEPYDSQEDDDNDDKGKEKEKRSKN